MDQLLKLHKELAEGKKEVDGMKSDIKVLEQELKAQDLMLQGQAPKIVVSGSFLYAHITYKKCLMLFGIERTILVLTALQSHNFNDKGFP